MTSRAVPFDGTPPAAMSGDTVMIRDVGGVWHSTTARSKPRYDFPNMIGRKCYLTVAVDWGGGVVNWPAEDVRLAVQ